MEEIKRLIELLNDALAALEKMRGAVGTFEQTDAPDLDRLRRAVKVLLARLKEADASLQAELTEAADIGKRLEGKGDGQPAAGAVTATDLAKGFRSVIQTIQREAGEGDVGDVGTIIKSMDVELKGLIVVEDQQPKVVPPSADKPVDPNTLSTIRMSFGSVPIERATVTPETQPRPRARRR